MKSILDPAFRYIPAVETDLRKTFARVRREQEKAKEPTTPSNVATIIQRKGAKA